MAPIARNGTSGNASFLSFPLTRSYIVMKITAINNPAIKAIIPFSAPSIKARAVPYQLIKVCSTLYIGDIGP